MTIQDAIKVSDTMRPNRIDDEQKIMWLSQQDGSIWNDLIRTHELPDYIIHQYLQPPDAPPPPPSMDPHHPMPAPWPYASDPEPPEEAPRGRPRSVVRVVQPSPVQIRRVPDPNGPIRDAVPIGHPELVQNQHAMMGPMERPPRPHIHLPDFPGYNAETDRGTQLLIREPYTDVYLFWLLSRIDLINQEIDIYSNDSRMYNNALDQYYKYYNRTYYPVQPVDQYRY